MIGVGIAGAGHFAAVHAQALRAVPQFRLVAAAASDLTAAGAFTATYGGRPYADWRALLDNPAVAVVLITLPHHLHAEIFFGVFELQLPRDGDAVVANDRRAPAFADEDAL